MIHEELLTRERQGRSLRIASTGAGWMGTGFVTALNHVRGMEIVVLADPEPGRAARALEREGRRRREEIVETTDPAQADEAIRAGQVVATTDITLGGAVEHVDLVTDVTPSPASGAATAEAALKAGKDVVLINIETDVTVGPALNRLAASTGALYSVSSGDEPGCLMELWDFVQTLGYEPIVIGKGKNNPLNPAANPDTVRASAEKAGMAPATVASYVDGTKTMFEMSCVANATGCRPMQPGMKGPEADLNTVSQVFALEEDGGMTSFPGAVDFVQGSAMSGGVFITVRVQDDRIAGDLNYLKVGSGNYFTFFRSYHLWFLEAPISLARAALHRQPTLVPLNERVAEVATVAKRDLSAGDVLGSFGSYDFFGRMYTAFDYRGLGALPVGLAPGARVTKAVKEGDMVTWDAVELDEESAVVRLRRELEQEM